MNWAFGAASFDGRKGLLIQPSSFSLHAYPSPPGHESLDSPVGGVLRCSHCGGRFGSTDLMRVAPTRLADAVNATLRNFLLRYSHGIFFLLLLMAGFGAGALARHWALHRGFSPRDAKAISSAATLATWFMVPALLILYGKRVERSRRARGLCVRCRYPLQPGSDCCARCGKEVARLS